jgi:urease beta subunit
MLTVSTTIIQGSGEAPKSAGLNSVVLLDASSNDGTTFDWDIISRPKGSNLMLDVPNGRAVRLGPIDKYGVYFVKLIVDQFLYNPQFTTVAINVPESVSIDTAPNPLIIF